jgi:iron complex transport system substrate-binding protein
MKPRNGFAAACALVAALSMAPPPARAALTVTDDTGATLTLAAPPRRIVSLAPGATEMLFAAGAGDRIVATVFGADEPQAARKLPRIGDANALDWERLVALKPDVVIAWKDLTNRLVVESLAKINMKVYFVSARSLDDIPASMRRLGAMVGTTAVAGPAAAALDARIAGIAARKVRGEPLRVFYMIWDVPLYTVGSRHIISDSIGRCGGRSIFNDIDFPAPIVEFESVVKRNPELILMSTTPITARDWRERWAKFPAIRAVATRQVVAFSDPRLDRMGPTAIDAVEGLCVRMDAVRSALAAADPPGPSAQK